MKADKTQIGRIASRMAPSPPLSAKEFASLVSATFQVCDGPRLADSLIGFSQTKQPQRETPSPFSDRRASFSSSKSVGMERATVPSISVSPPESRPEQDLFTPYVPLVLRHERVTKARRASDNDSASIFSRGRGSCYVPSFLFSPPSDYSPPSSPRPSSYVPSQYSAETGVKISKPDTHSSLTPNEPAAANKPRPSSRDWTLYLESSTTYSGSHQRQIAKSSPNPVPSLRNANTDLPSTPSNRYVTAASALSRRLPAFSDSPPPSPLYSESSSDDSVGSSTAPSFVFSNHPYSNSYSVSFASRSMSSLTDVSPHHPVLDNKSSRTSRRDKHQRKCGSTSSNSSSQSGWWFDDDWVMCDPDEEEDDMLYYSANSSFTSFLSFS